MESVQTEAAEIVVAYRTKQESSKRPVISSSDDAHRIAVEAFNRDTIELCEEFIVIYMNRANKVLGVYKAGVGGVTGVVADPRLVIAVALKIAAVSFIACHNHPSGSLRPSRQDQELTNKLKEGAKFMDLKLLDHLIIAPDLTSYLSMADEGLL
jgi:DNA repair protein RadC